MNEPVRPSDVQSALPLDAPPPAGHNNPPAYDPDQFAAMVAGVTDFAAAGGEWLDLEQIETAEQASYLADFIAGARKKAKQIEEWRVEAKRPHDIMAKAVQDAAKIPGATIERVIARALALLTPWQREQQRIANEEAERRRIEAQRQRDEAARLEREALARNDIAGQVEAEAAAKAARDLEKSADRLEGTGGQARSASGAGRTIALVTTKTARIVNQRLLYVHFEAHPAVLQVLQTLANSAIRAKGFTGTLPGIEIITEENAR